MTAAQIVKELEGLGTDSYKRILKNHGAKEPVVGVKIADLKKYQKQIKKDHQLALALFDSGIYDAQYLAGLIADEAKMTKKDLRHWLAEANCPAISGTIVAWVAAESRYGWDLALDWIDARKENTAQTGWSTLSSLVSVQDDADLDVRKLGELLQRVEKSIHQQPNLVRYAMNGFVIALGAYVPELTRPAMQAGKKIGKVTVDMGNTACEVPYAPEYLERIQQRGTIGKKRKTARC